MRYWLKKCSRCLTGDLHEEQDTYGVYIACVQCGYILTSLQEQELLGISLVETPRVPREIAA
jgi:DNA-directed RNA polymerase subunit RPC12/RpoP